MFNNLKVRIMKVNLENLVKVLKYRFDGKVDLHIYCNDEEIEDILSVNTYYDDVQIGIMNVEVPTIADVKTIVNTFFKNANDVIHVDNSWGFIDLFISDGVLRKEIDDTSLEILKMALPIEKAKLIA